MKGLIFKEQGCSLNMFASRKRLRKKNKGWKKKGGKENKNVLIQKNVLQRQKAHGTNLVTHRPSFREFYNGTVYL